MYINWLQGILAEKSLGYVVLEVSGVGYEVEMPATMLALLPDPPCEQKLYIHHVVREDAALLYGFSTQLARDVFRQLIKVSGVGPKMALAILSHLDVNQLLACVQGQSLAVLMQVKGVGRKLAEKLLIELKDRLFDLYDSKIVLTDDFNKQQQAVEALISLGYAKSQVERVVKQLVCRHDSQVQDLIRQALQQLASS